jgi:hypothetical protein
MYTKDTNIKVKRGRPAQLFSGLEMLGMTPTQTIALLHL